MILKVSSLTEIGSLTNYLQCHFCLVLMLPIFDFLCFADLGSHGIWGGRVGQDHLLWGQD